MKLPGTAPSIHMSPAREEIFRPMEDKDTLVKLRRKRKRLAKTAFA
jgi:hypothetical protein